MRVIDAFIFYNEIDLLKIRLELLYDHVDLFLICEANCTFSGNKKQYNFIAHEHEFSKWEKKIVYIKYEPDLNRLDFSHKDTSFNPNSAPWQIEAGQRNFLSSYLNTLDDNDIAIISDVDEIWGPELSSLFRDKNIKIEKARLEMSFHYYYLNCRGVGVNNSKWYHAFFTKISYIKLNPDISFIRSHEEIPHIIKNAGWHFSYLGGADNISLKIESFSHQELNTPEINNKSHLEKCIHLGIDYLNRPGHEWAFSPIDFYPSRLANLMRLNPHLIRTNLL